MKRGLLIVNVFMVVTVALVLWLYVHFLVPRMTGSPSAKLALPILFVFLVFVPYVGALRGNTFETRTESQTQWAHGFKYWFALAFVVISPFSVPVAGIVSVAILIGSFVYAYLWRPQAKS